MDIGGILAPGTVNPTILKQWQLGERMLVEVIGKTAEGEGTIRIKGQDVAAILDTPTQIGEKFWVQVADLNEGRFLLIREPVMNQQEATKVVPQQFPQLMERGLPQNQEISALIKSFTTASDGLVGPLNQNGTGTMTDELIKILKRSTPEWGGLSEENGAEVLVESLRKLGLNYEQRVQQLLKLDSPARETEKKGLGDTFKFTLLEAIQKEEGQGLSDSKGPLNQLLLKLTGQQLWLKTGTQNNAYILLQLPLSNKGQFVPAQIAIESARKGPKMDEEHCRIALQIKTQELGEVGIDAFFNHDTLSFQVLTHDLDLLPQLLEEVLPMTKEAFSKLGFNITKVETGELEKNLEFKSFLKGLRRSGVDVQK